MSGELRGRIADALESAEVRWDFEHEASQESRAYIDPGPKLPSVAQAIIDEFELTYIRTGRSIVGKWEKQ